MYRRKIHCAYRGDLRLPEMGPDIVLSRQVNKTTDILILPNLSPETLAAFRLLSFDHERRPWLVGLAQPGQVEQVVDAFCHGVASYCWTDTLDRLGEILALTIQNRRVLVDASVAQALDKRLKHVWSEDFTERELEVLNALALEMPLPTELQYAERHLASLLAKLTNAAAEARWFTVLKSL